MRCFYEDLLLSFAEILKTVVEVYVCKIKNPKKSRKILTAKSDGDIILPILKSKGLYVKCRQNGELSVGRKTKIVCGLGLASRFIRQKFIGTAFSAKTPSFLAICNAG